MIRTQSTAAKGPQAFAKFECHACHEVNGENFPAPRESGRAHHWRFGDMPAQPSARVDEISLIVRYVGELQRANGIE